MKGTRHISYVTLSDKLRQFEREGVAVPTLQKQVTDPPQYVETRGNVERYRLGETILEVRPSEVIDSFGNIVDLDRLQRAAYLTAVRNLQDKIYLGDFP